MGLRAVWRRRRATSAAAVSLLSTALVGAAIAYPGTPTAQVDLNDGGVWVTNSALNLLGHLNFQAGELDSSLRSASSHFDVVQAAGEVLLADSGAGTVSPVDPANVRLKGDGHLPAGATVLLGGSTVAIVSADAKQLWVLDSGQAAAFDQTAVKPTARFEAPAAVTVGVDGTVWAAVASTGKLIGYLPGAAPQSRSLPGVPVDSTLQVTAVGSHAVVLDPGSGSVSVDGGNPVAVAGAAKGVLQQAGTDAADVEVAGPDALIDVPLDGSASVSHPAGGTGTPTAPVRLNGCSYAAWSGSARYVRDCAGTASDVARGIPSATDGVLRFRVNRDVVVLNNLSTGAVWLTDDAMTLVNNWQDVTPKDQKADDQQQTTDSADTQAADRSQQNQPPVAVDDHFGVRPGRTTILPVLANDSDPDGDVLTATAKTQPSFGTLQSIRNDEAFQLAVPADATGSTSFQYTASDGRGGTADATVTVEVHGASVENAPVQDRVMTLVVTQGRTAKVNVLPGWSDPDGDDVFLQAATATTDDQVQFTQDGEVTFTDVGTSTGLKKVTLVVSDGTKTTEGTLQVQVTGPDEHAPVANADHVSTLVGQPVTVSPLDNDTDQDGDVLRLAKVDDAPGLTITRDLTAGTFTATAATAGSYYVTYTITDGPASAQGIVRIDVSAPDAASGVPVAVRDTGLLPAGGVVYVDPLANDVDPAGGILVVQGTTLPAASPLTVALVDHHLLRISAQAALSGPASFTYTVSNGTASATGEVVVLPVPAPTVNQPPVAKDDTAQVRVGDVVDVPVLGNDVSPSGAALSVAHDLVQAPESGTAFVMDDRVRFRAPSTPGTVHLIYKAVDPSGQSASAQVTITVRASDATDSPPVPLSVTARALAGQTIRIPITLDGIDPDGDSVQLVGIGSAPAKGRVVTVGASWLNYEASKDASGTDEFTYQVVDRLGAVGTATVRVGIAPAASTNQQPVAVPDKVTARPGRSLAVPVLANDIDPDGDPLTLVQNSLQVSDPSVTATVSGDRVDLTTPNHAEVVTIYYGVSDGKTGTVIGSLTVTVDPNAPLLAPVAQDDRVAADTVDAKTSTTVAVLANDEDPDGSTGDLKVSCTVAGVSVDAQGRLTVPVTDTAQSILYTDTDVDGLTGSAFVWVPGAHDLRPRLRSTDPVSVDSGAKLTLKLADYVTVAAGKTPRVTTAASVAALHGNGDPVLVDAATLAFTSAKGYYGAASVTFGVTDGNGPDDPAGHTAVLTIPITVKPPANQPPTFTGSTIQVAPGEKPAEVDLTTLTTDPDDGDLPRMAYTLVGGDPGNGITASVSGQKLTVAAGESTPKGTTVTLRLKVSDGTTEPVDGTENVQVVASTRPLAVANDDLVPAAAQGRPVTVDVLANDQNPFPDTPLTLVGTPTVESGSGSVALNGQKVVVTPSGDFFGTMVVVYRVQDATKEADRQVEGRIRLTVQGRPAKPGTPTVSQVRSKTVVLAWAAPADNGAQITGYTVHSNDGRTFTCPSTTCTLDGLTNDQTYTFTVVATNSVGDSDPSPASAEARPDQVPTAPNPPTLTFGDKQLRVAWNPPPAFEGSAVSSYTLEISPPPSSGVAQVTGIATTSYTWTGLDNGTSYTVRAQALNKAGASDWSAYSTAQIPAGVPDAPAQPATARLDPVGSQAQLQVTWSAPKDNGDAIKTYTLHTLRGGTEVSALTVPGGTTQQAVKLDTSESDYTFTVTATNKAGTGAASPASAGRRAFVAPGNVPNVTATPGDNTVTLAYGAASGNGATASELSYQYQVNGGSWIAVPGDKVIRSGVGNNGTYTIGVRAVTTMDGVTYYSASATNSNPVAPFGPPNRPAVSASGSRRSVTLNWSAPARNGRDFHVEISIDGGAWQNVGAGGGSTTTGDGYDQTHSIAARTVDTEGQASGVAGAAASTYATHPITVSNPTYHHACKNPSQNSTDTPNNTCGSGSWSEGTALKVVCYATGTAYVNILAENKKANWNYRYLTTEDLWLLAGDGQNGTSADGDNSFGLPSC